MGSRRTEADNVYKAASKWVDSALRTDGSLFTPGKPIWSSRWLGELHERFLNHPDASRGPSFADKLKRQLADSPSEVYQLMGEALYVHFLIVSIRTIGGEKKKKRINTVLEWMSAPVEIPQNLADGLVPGFVRSQNLNADRPFHVGFIIEFVEQWKQKSTDELTLLLENPWEFKNFLYNIPLRSRLFSDGGNRHRMQREAILHLVFPDTFETIISSGDKEKIAATFADLVKEQTDDVDRKLTQIREGLEPEYGKDFHFYGDDSVKSIWQEDGQKKRQPVSPSVDASSAPEPSSDLKTLADQLLFDIKHLHEIKKLLEDKRQVIFQGPPGTGKTYVARELANCLSGSKERVRLVQFHPSYAYEDFVQGYRPALVSGQPGFELRNGPLLEAAEQARAEPEAKHFLIIDEINRGNLSKVFGELYFLLEYRDEEMRLLYADEPFSLPKNLYIIGTMNTADRSIALVDLALRRRFHFVEFHPDTPPVQGLLRRWLEQNAPTMLQVADIVDCANKKLDDQQAAIGPSYFMKPGLDEDMLRLIWEHNVRPYIEEHLYGEHDRLGEFDLDTLRRETPNRGAEQDAADASA